MDLVLAWKPCRLDCWPAAIARTISSPPRYNAMAVAFVIATVVAIADDAIVIIIAENFGYLRSC